MVIFRVFCYLGEFLVWWFFGFWLTLGFVNLGISGFVDFWFWYFRFFCFSFWISILAFGCALFGCYKAETWWFAVFYFGLGLILLLILVGWLEVGITNLLWLFVWICCFVFFGCLVWVCIFRMYSWFVVWLLFGVIWLHLLCLLFGFIIGLLLCLGCRCCCWVNWNCLFDCWCFWFGDGMIVLCFVCLVG